VALLLTQEHPSVLQGRDAEADRGTSDEATSSPERERGTRSSPDISPVGDAPACFFAADDDDAIEESTLVKARVAVAGQGTPSNQTEQVEVHSPGRVAEPDLWPPIADSPAHEDSLRECSSMGCAPSDAAATQRVSEAPRLFQEILALDEFVESADVEGTDIDIDLSDGGGAKLAGTGGGWVVMKADQARAHLLPDGQVGPERHEFALMLEQMQEVLKMAHDDDTDQDEELDDAENDPEGLRQAPIAISDESSDGTSGLAIDQALHQTDIIASGSSEGEVPFFGAADQNGGEAVGRIETLRIRLENLLGLDTFMEAYRMIVISTDSLQSAAALESAERVIEDLLGEHLREALPPLTELVRLEAEFFA
jgi:hypothetical protein